MKIIKITLLGFFLLGNLGLMAQEQTKEEAKDDREARKIAIITEKLALTPDESKVFWPIHKEFEKEYKALRKNFKKTKEAGKKMDELNDDEVDKILLESFDFKQKQLDLKKIYHLKYKEVLAIKKIAKLYHLEHKMQKEEGPERNERRERRERPEHGQ
jgi:hypothetical protein